MSLESCVACGHALAIADHQCRHCSSASIATQRGVKSIALYLLVAFAGLVVAVLIYNLFLR
jgi:predicted nucleic acid-binding Zn ribbon protein